MTLLEVNNLAVHFAQPSGVFTRRRDDVRAVDGVSFRLESGRSLGILGASGCGKSTLAQALIGLVPITAGTILLNGNSFDIKQDRAAIQIVFQDPQTSFNPRRRVWQLITEPLVIAGERDQNKLRKAAESLAEKVGVAAHQLDRFPHEFSGGQRQRLAIARALAINPGILILDEPTSALDVSVQAQVLNLLVKLQRELGVSYLFISHDVSVVRHICDDVVVMKQGQFVEAGQTTEILGNPRHPYTQALVAAVPALDGRAFRDHPQENSL